jgi:hypothetical protein
VTTANDYEAGYLAGFAAACRTHESRVTGRNADSAAGAVLPAAEVERIALAVWRGTASWQDRRRLDRHYLAQCPF